MEELFVYAMLCCVGFDAWPVYTETLDRLFLGDQENEEYLSLEEMPPKHAVLHTLSVMQREKLDVEVFGKTFVKIMRQVYENTELEYLSRKMVSLWDKLPLTIALEEPFWYLSFVDEYLPHDEQGCRELWEKLLHFYD